MSKTSDRQKKLKEFIERRHPDYDGRLAHWEFVLATYKGGREWFDGNIFRYVKEGDDEFEARLQRAYRFNHSREVVDLLNKYLFKMEVQRAGDAPESVKRFWKQATLNRLPIHEFMKSVSTGSSIFGRVWVVVDSTKNADIRTIADEKKSDARVYSYMIDPMNALDMSYDALGGLNWILFREIGRDDEDPIESSGEEIERYRLWTRDYWKLFEVEYGPGNKVTIIEHEEVPHNLGVVPVVPVDNVLSDALYTSPGFIDDVAYLDRAIANYLSNMDAIIQDQTFSQLAMPAQGLLPGEDGYNKLIEMGTKRIFTYDGEHGAEPFYLSPDVKQAELILKVINKIIGEIYHTVGMAGERTKDDNSQGIDNSSGVAKAYDFERVNSLLAAKADSLQLAENRIARLVALWHGEEGKIDSRGQELVSYPDNFDVRGLYDEFDIASRLALIEAPDMMRREQMDLVRQKLFPQLSKDLVAKMKEELKSWPPKLEESLATTGGTKEISKAGRNSLANKLVKGKK